MQEAFGVVIFAVVAIASVVALITFAVSRKAYDDIGRGTFAMRDEVPTPAPPRPRPPPWPSATTRSASCWLPATTAARAGARRRWTSTQELKRLTGPVVDPGLRDEVRQLVIARNDRRQRAGKAPLDVDAEVERQLHELNG